jgi:hypothetical protein
VAGVNGMRKTRVYKRIFLLGFLPVSVVLIVAAKNSSYFAEQIFALHIYKFLSQILSSVFGIFPFSVAEILVILLLFFVFFILIRFFLQLIKNKENRKQRMWRGLLNAGCFASVALFLFVILAGINYYRYPFSYYSKLQIGDSSVEDLYALNEHLIQEANRLRVKAHTDENGVFQLPMKEYQLADLANHAMEHLAKEYPVLDGSYGAPKPVLLSPLMSYTEITGIFMPFTMEANVNVAAPDYSVPATMLHELAHLRGFMREDEANYIAYLAGIESGNDEIAYSSTMLAVETAGNALYEQSQSLYFKIRDQYSKGVLKDIRESIKYWQKYDDGAISTISNTMNDTYLKANNQTDGVKSYGRMVDLLIAKYKKDRKDGKLK